MADGGDSSLALGTVVKLHGLSNASLNGRVGEIVGPLMNTGRMAVHLDGDCIKEKKAVRPTNMMKLDGKGLLKREAARAQVERERRAMVREASYTHYLGKKDRKDLSLPCPPYAEPEARFFDIYGFNSPIHDIYNSVKDLSDEALDELSDVMTADGMGDGFDRNEMIDQSGTEVQQRRARLGELLATLRMEKHWGPEGTTDMVHNVIDGLANANFKGYLTPPLTAEETEHLAVLSLFCTCHDDHSDLTILGFETIDPLIKTAGQADALDTLCKLGYTLTNGRGAVAVLAAEVIAGDGPARGRKAKNTLQNFPAWVTHDHIASVCGLISDILSDPQALPECSGHLAVACKSLLQTTRSQEVWDLIGDALRNASAEERLDTSHAGDLDKILRDVSVHLWVHEDVETPADAAPRSGDDDESWNFYFTQFRKTPHGLSPCRCTPPEPLLFCWWKRRMKDKKEALTALATAETAMKAERYEQAYALATRALAAYTRKNDAARHSDYHDVNAQKMRNVAAEALLGLERTEDAIDMFNVNLKSLYGGQDGAKVNANLGLVRGYAQLGDVEAANKQVEKIRAQVFRGREGPLPGSDYTWQTCLDEAVKLVEACKLNPPAVVEADVFATVCAAAAEPIATEVRRWSWRSSRAGDEDEVFAWAVWFEHSSLVGVIVRNVVLLWNYATSTIWHQIDMTHGCQIHYQLAGIEVPGPSGAHHPYLVFHSTVHGEPAVVDVLRLTPGGKSIPLEGMFNTFTDHLMEIYDEVQWGLKAEHLDMGRAADGRWILATGRHKGDMHSVRVQFSSHSRFGPFGLDMGARSRMNLLGHAGEVDEVKLGEPASGLLLSHSRDYRIKMWDLKSGTCRFTVRDVQTQVWRLCCPAAAGFFCVGTYTYRSRKQRKQPLPVTDRGIQVRSTENGKLIAMLQGPDDTDLTDASDLAVLPGTGTLISSHNSGVVHLWEFADGAMQHLRSVAVSEADHIRLMLSASGRVLTVVSPIRSFMTQFALPIPGNKARPQTAGSLARNCRHCGLFKPESSSMCGGCKAAWFCDKTCLKKGWKAHKPTCIKASENAD